MLGSIHTGERILILGDLRRIDMNPDQLKEKREQLSAILKKHTPVLISYSGGIDSALLAIIARKDLGKILCVMVAGPEVPFRELKNAREIADTFDLPLQVIHREVGIPDDMRENPENRCYHCKISTAKMLKKQADLHGFRFIADGVNMSDTGEHRPGIEASTSSGVIHPYILAGITKEDIREIARDMGLTFWNKPSSACLYSRIPYRDEVTINKLAMIEHAEDFLLDHGFTQVRVRLHGDLARIELLPEEMVKLFQMRELIEETLHTIGFDYVTLDLKGYRSGSMDETLSEPV